jgi:hypoxanthine phosphoribosyltransferase
MDFGTDRNIIFSAGDLKKRIAELGRQITLDYAGRDLVLVGVLKGSLYFLSDLSREIGLPLQIDLISVGVYPNSTGRTGVVRLTKDLDCDITGKHVLIVEDIIRSGLTTGYLLQNLETRGAAGIAVCTLLLSPEEQLIGIPISYVGFEVSKARLLGYGLDVDEKGRNLPYIAEIT